MYFAGCSETSETSNESSTVKDQENETSEKNDDGNDDIKKDVASDSVELSITNQITFEKLTIVDNKKCSIEITGIDVNGLLGYSFNINLENKSKQETMFGVEGVSGNGYMEDPYYATSIGVGKKSLL